MQQITINCHSSICIGGDVYIDPYNITDVRKNAKCIFITHPHYDHLDMVSIKNLATEDTIIIAPFDAIAMLQEEGYEDENLKVVKPNESGVAYDIKYQTFPAYNIDKKFHPKENDWVGYTLTIDNTRYTICGDSDKTPELEQIKTDVLLVPIGGTYTMTAQEGGELANIIKPTLAIPTHYACIVGTKDDEKVFCKTLIGVNSKILV